MVTKTADGNEKLTSGSQERAEALADYFSSVFIKEDETALGILEKEYVSKKPSFQMSTVSISVEQVKKTKKFKLQ